VQIYLHYINPTLAETEVFYIEQLEYDANAKKTSQKRRGPRADHRRVGIKFLAPVANDCYKHEQWPSQKITQTNCNWL
jgi:hypothetical protein